MIDQRIVLSWHIGITITWYRVQQIADIIKLRLNERGVPDVGSRLSYCNYRAVIPIEKEDRALPHVIMMMVMLRHFALFCAIVAIVCDRLQRGNTARNFPDLFSIDKESHIRVIQNFIKNSRRIFKNERFYFKYSVNFTNEK